MLEEEGYPLIKCNRKRSNKITKSNLIMFSIIKLAKMEDNEICCGLVTRDILQVVDISGTDYIGNVVIRLGQKKIMGQLLMIEADKYDIAVFCLLREMFGLGFPPVLIIEYDCIRYIVTKRRETRGLREDDFYPYTVANREFRFKLAILIYLCKLIGCPLSFNDIRVHNGSPIFWRCNYLGLRKASSVSNDIFMKLFGMSLEHGRRGLMTQFAKTVIDYFRNVDFDTDELRGCLYLRDGIIRYAKGTKIKYKLSRYPRQIEDVIEENYVLLRGNRPFNIFR